MQRYKAYFSPAAILLLCLVNIHFGLRGGNPLLVGGGTVGIAYLILQMAHLGAAGQKKPAEKPDTTKAAPAAAPALPRPAATLAADPSDPDGLVEQMLVQGRYALLLRRQIAVNLNDAQFHRALESLEAGMAEVAEGEVLVGGAESAGRGPSGPPPEPAAPEGRVTDASTAGHRVRVEPLFLDRYPVTNRQFYEFVAAGGYRQMALWDLSVRPAVPQLVDRTGRPGPRFWQEGCFLPGEDDLPVVGVNWYEAAAYARWVGKRLPTDAEWVKAASCPVAVEGGGIVQRRYPWGDAMDLKRANLWGAGPGRVVAVQEFAEGASVGELGQLIGNVWEWTSGNFQGNGGDPLLPGMLKTIRGGAFDTYFDSQATCQFASGEEPLRGRHNIGFRCAIGTCDLMLWRDDATADEAAADQPAAVAEEAIA